MRPAAAALAAACADACAAARARRLFAAGCWGWGLKPLHAALVRAGALPALAGDPEKNTPEDALCGRLAAEHTARAYEAAARGCWEEPFRSLVAYNHDDCRMLAGVRMLLE